VTTRIQDIIVRVRDALGDPNATRWTDARLVRLIDKAQKIIARDSELLRSKEGQPIRKGVADYSIPDDAYKPNRFTILGQKVTPISHEEMDDLSDRGLIQSTYVETTEGSRSSWEEHEGNLPDHLVYDKLNPGKFKLYPIPETAFSSVSMSIVDTSNVPALAETFDNDWSGLLVYVTNYEFSSAFGITVEERGYQWKLNCKLASTANVTVATGLEAGDSIDGVVLSEGDRVLLKDQTTESENGIYVAVALGAGAASRATDCDTDSEMFFATASITHGDTNINTHWACTNDPAPEVGVDDLTFEQIDDWDGYEDGDYTTYYDLIGDLDEMQSNKYGLCVLIEDASEQIMVYYIKKPTTLTAVTDSLEIDIVWDTAIERFVIGSALRDNKDTQDRQVGNEELMIYESELSKAKKDAKDNFTATKTQYTTPYNGGFSR
jgi:hypothetical protein